MPNATQLSPALVNRGPCPIAVTWTLAFALIMIVMQAAQAQTFSVLHNFTGGTDGAGPTAGVTVAPSGVLYGTASNGGISNFGTVFKLTQVNSSWVFSTLYEFGSGDGITPYGGVAIGPNGALYGTTNAGGEDDFGLVFELRPPATFCRSVTCYWNESVLHTFTGPPDGQYPGSENLTFDQAGNIYGTTKYGGARDEFDGTTFELTPSGGGWTESILHSFSNLPDGEVPYAGVVLDTAGNVYGTTAYGGTGTGCPTGCGTVYQLMPSGGGWVTNILVNLGGVNGSYPIGNLIIDASGNLYGTTPGQKEGGAVFKLTHSGGGFTYSVLYNFTSCESYGGLAIDAAGDLFGVCQIGGAHNDGWIFELTNCSQGCNVVDLHDFSGRDGNMPYGAPVLDANGNLYGTTFYGGTGICGGGPYCGVVWEIAGVGARHKN